MNLAQTFQRAIQDANNWYKENGMSRVNWNFVDADCYMACANEYPNPDAFYDEFNALCDIYCMTQNSHALQMNKILVDTVPA